MTLTLEGNLDIPKMYHYTENEDDSLRRSKLRAFEKYENISQDQNVKSS